MAQKASAGDVGLLGDMELGDIAVDMESMPPCTQLHANAHRRRSSASSLSDGYSDSQV
jgi:hypothetical protein